MSLCPFLFFIVPFCIIFYGELSNKNIFVLIIFYECENRISAYLLFGSFNIVRYVLSGVNLGVPWVRAPPTENYGGARQAWHPHDFHVPCQDVMLVSTA